MTEDTKRLNEKTRKEIAEARAEIKNGRFHTLKQIKELLNLDVRPEYLEKLNKIQKQKGTRFKSVEDLRKATS